MPSRSHRRIANLGRSIVTGIANAAFSVGQFFAHIPYGKIGGGIIRVIGNIMHMLLFKILLPKKYRKLTKKEIYNIIFKSDTPAGKRFDIWLIILIFFNVFLLVLESMPLVYSRMRITLGVLQWICTIIFTFEYYLRIYCLKHPYKYIFSFYGIIDFLSIFPAYLSLFMPATQTLSVLRILRTMRVFRVLKLQRFIDESSSMLNALKRSMYKILIFMFFVFLTAVILGAVVYMFEKGHNPLFTSIPRSIYWAVVTLTAVGYGDMTPITIPGRFISVVIMILGYSVIAVLTGIVTSETVQAGKTARDRKAAANMPPQSNTTSATPPDPGSIAGEYDEPKADKKAEPVAEEEKPYPKYCPHCGYEEADEEAVFCRMCGTRLQNEQHHSWINDFFEK